MKITLNKMSIRSSGDSISSEHYSSSRLQASYSFETASFVSLTLTSDLTLEVIAPGPVFMTSLLLDWPVGWAEFHRNPWTLDR